MTRQPSSRQTPPLDPIEPATLGLLCRQLGRSPRGAAGVAVRCPHGCPAVVATRPYLEDGTPFPTALYLSCPSAVARVAVVEAAGGVRELRARIAADAGVRAALVHLDNAYRAYRRALHALGPSSGPPEAGRIEGDTVEGGHADEGGRRGGGRGGGTATQAGVEQDLLDSGLVFARGVGGAKDPLRLTCLHALAAALLTVLGGGLGEGNVDADTMETWRSLLAEMGDLWCDGADCLGTPGRPEWRAAIDVGTNSVRLLVADLREESGLLVPAPVVRRAEVTRLGEGLVDGGLLREEAKARTRQAVERYVAEARGRAASVVTVVGTSATRRAADGVAFMQELGATFGVTAGVATGRVEALMAYAGATLDVPGDVVLLDVGGGSTELVRWVESDRLTAVSLDVGCVRATEDWIRSDPAEAGERAAVREEALRLVEQAAAEFKGGEALVAVAGTATTLAAHVLKLDQYRPEVVHLTVLNRAQVEAALEELATMPAEARVALPYMQAGRADVIVAGAEILLAAMDALEYSLVLVSERDILDGIIMANAG